MTIDVVTAAHRHLHTFSSQLVSAGLHPADPVNATDAYPEPWIFPDKPRRSVNGTGTCSVVVSNPNGWTGPNAHNTEEFPRLQIEVYADQDRDDVAAPERRTARAKAYAIYRIIDLVFHRPDAGGFSWDELRIVNSVRGAEYSLDEVPDADGTVRLLVSYNVSLG